MLAFLLIIGLSFLLTANRLTQYVSDFLFQQRIRQDGPSVQRLATTVAPLFRSAESEAINEAIASAGGEMGGRVMVVDGEGKVQYDSFVVGSMIGVRLTLPEIVNVLISGGNNPPGEQNVSYGVHQVEDEQGGHYVSYCAASMTGSRGAILYANNVDEIVDSLGDVQRELIMVFAVVAVAALCAALFFSHLLTVPISRLTRSIRRMGGGDLSVRVPVSGSAELRRLASSYNTMAEQLETLDKSRNQFVSDASHELKTPLTAMKSLLEDVLYQPGMPPQMQREFLMDVDHEIDRLSDIISDLLTLTRMDSGKLELHAEPLCLSDGCEESLHMLRQQAERRNQLLISHIAPDIWVNGDPSKLSQVIWNLVENAIKYTQDGGRIDVRLQEKNGKAVFSVQDNGVGIPEEDQAHVFERFYRVDKARSRDTGGTGLGLSIVKQMVALHGGDITVKSRHGEGSTFTVTLPIRKKEED